MRLARFAWLVLGYTVLVVIWGGFVRATGSGAGCGDHWPLCNGEVVPRSPSVETIIELTHRITSGLCGLLVLALVIWTFRRFERGHIVRKAAVVSGVFLIVEAAIGAGLVLFEYVAYNPSFARAYWMVAHLINTFLLLGALSLTAWWASGFPRPVAGTGRLGVLSIALLGTLIVGASGAVAALGDTLVLGGGLDPDTDPIVGALVGLRLYHPTIAVIVAIAIGLAVVLVLRERRLGAGAAPTPPTLRLGILVGALYISQMIIGLVNVQLLAPVWMQMVHLFMADALWIALVLFSASALAEPRRVPVTGRGSMGHRKREPMLVHEDAPSA